jgi:integrase
MAKDPIKTLTLQDGTKRYRFVVDIGRDPQTGKRKQKTFTFDKKGDARKEYNRIKHQTDTGTYVPPADVTVNEVIDSYLKSKTRGRRTNTMRTYQSEFRCPRERFGTWWVQRITKDDIEDLVEYMLTRGRKEGGKPGTGLSGRSVNGTLSRLSAAFELAVREGKLVRNVVKLVEKAEHTPRERATWSKAQVHQFLRAIEGSRLEAAWRLSFYGLRRGEVLGLRWEDINLTDKTLTVRQARLRCNHEVLIHPPKSRNGERTLPFDDVLTVCLRRMRKKQAAESEEAGQAYRAELAGLPWYTGGEYLVTDEIGTPVRPEWYSAEFARILKRAGLPRIRLHDSRHSTLSLMEKAGVPISIISAWAGHHDPSFTYKVYVHGDNEDDLKRGSDTLARIYKIA